MFVDSGLGYAGIEDAELVTCRRYIRSLWRLRERGMLGNRGDTFMKLS
ncbi:hypothetical protein GCM10027288_51860 [Bordetella tumbae]